MACALSVFVVAIAVVGCQPHKSGSRQSTNVPRLTITDRVNQKGKTAREKEGLHGPVRSVKVEAATAVDGASARVEGKRRLIKTETFTQNGGLIERTTISPDSRLTVRILFSRDRNGRDTGMSRYLNGKLRSKMVLELDAKGKTLAQVNYGADGKVDSRIVPSYDKNGHVVGSETFDAKGSLQSKVGQKYDKRGFMVEQAVCDAGGKLASKTVYDYNSNGDQTRWHAYDAAGKLQAAEKLTIYTDRNGLESTYYNGDGSMSSKDISIFDAKWRPTEKAKYAPSGTLKDKTIYVYESGGDVLNEKHIGKNGDVTSKFSYTYQRDSHGNWIKQTKTGRIAKNGKLTVRSRETKYRVIAYYK